MKKVVLLICTLALCLSTAAQTYTGDQQDVDEILRQVDAWSEYYVNGEVRKLAGLYTEDGKIMPNNADIITGRDAIAERFQLKDAVVAIHHKVTPEEIVIENETAYDHGYYEGATKDETGLESPFRGKYVIVWKKVDGTWLIYLDIWNRILVAD